ncbi:MAG: DNA gyrase C-terminal beta-propeller domain-containing protein, partial [bacterium]
VVAAVAMRDNDSVLMMSTHGQTIRTSMKDVRVLGRSTQGVRLVNLDKGDTVMAVQKIENIEKEDV